MSLVLHPNRSLMRQVESFYTEQTNTIGKYARITTCPAAARVRSPAARDLPCHGRSYDRPMRDDDWYKPHPHRPGSPSRQPKPGEEVWRLKGRDGRLQSCELRDDSKAGAGWDVMLLEDGEPLFSRRCGDERRARIVAEATRMDLLRTGWREAVETRG
jgi:hypothetical protein